MSAGSLPVAAPLAVSSLSPSSAVPLKKGYANPAAAICAKERNPSAACSCVEEHDPICRPDPADARFLTKGARVCKYAVGECLLGRPQKGDRKVAGAPCGASFKTPTDLRRHEMGHRKAAAFACFLCGDFFTQKIQMVTHLGTITHQKALALAGVQGGEEALGTPARSFACRQCPKQFNDRSAFVRHKKMHERKKDAPATPSSLPASSVLASSSPSFVPASSSPSSFPASSSSPHSAGGVQVTAHNLPPSPFSPADSGVCMEATPYELPDPSFESLESMQATAYDPFFLSLPSVGGPQVTAGNLPPFSLHSGGELQATVANSSPLPQLDLGLDMVDWDSIMDSGSTTGLDSAVFGAPTWGEEDEGVVADLDLNLLSHDDFSEDSSPPQPLGQEAFVASEVLAGEEICPQYSFSDLDPEEMAEVIQVIYSGG
ncbi:hypothetical protein K402DRAFT_399935 [Aulographum hederae CBS 113979]|uniref:C2H2-type domain-containing protein n=1 Tax=Aulographum hederae CBS 113979 TaxID=1176131 RepID=A0A6G1HFI5_9PEZI|nr:hypothetical protein K402DRAFT_399935 [Aulographum hederae CBS 113979]